VVEKETRDNPQDAMRGSSTIPPGVELTERAGEIRDVQHPNSD
jgi:hypothetical protein